MAKSQFRWCVARLFVPHLDVRRKYAILAPSGKGKMKAGNVFRYHNENHKVHSAQPSKNGVTCKAFQLTKRYSEPTGFSFPTKKVRFSAAVKVPRTAPSRSSSTR